MKIKRRTIAFSSVIFLFLYLAASCRAQNRSWLIPNQANGLMNELKFNYAGVTSIVPHGGAAITSYNGMQDINGTLLFYVQDGEIFDAHDNLIDGFYDSNNVHLVVGTPEICIVPVPGNCSRYYIISAGPTTPGGGLFDAKPSYVTLDLSLPNVINSSLRGALVGNTGSAYTAPVTYLTVPNFNYDAHSSSVLLAVSKLRGSGTSANRLLFVADNSNLFKFVIDGNGIGSGSFVGTPGGFNSVGFNTEMDLWEGASGNFKLAVPYHGHNNNSGVSIFDLDIAGTLIPPTAPVTNPTDVELLSSNGLIRGLEFSSSGQYVYITNNQPPYLQFIDLLASAPISLNLQNVLNLSTSLAIDFKDSQIERGYDGRIYFAAGDRMGTLNTPNNPYALSAFSNQATDVSGNPLPGLSMVHSNFITDDFFMLPDQIDGEVYQSYSSSSPECCAVNTVYDVEEYEASGGANVIWQPVGVGTNPFSSTGTVTIGSKLIVPAGINLTIRDMTFEFRPGAKVIVQQGATLIMDHSIFTNSCDGMWQGMVVEK